MKTRETRIIIAVLTMLILFSQAGLKMLEAGSLRLPVKTSQASIWPHSSYDQSYTKSCTQTTISGMQGILNLVQRSGICWQIRSLLLLSLISVLLSCLFIFLYGVFFAGNQPRRKETAILQYIHAQDGKK